MLGWIERREEIEMEGVDREKRRDRYKGEIKREQRERHEGIKKREEIHI